ncbi:MAG: zinc carboxypeptidase [Flaviaesturariibacter sp.]|nr:zinc carboxypeptidase [Flaviaesturariibacter sp.]
MLIKNCAVFQPDKQKGDASINVKSGLTSSRNEHVRGSQQTRGAVHSNPPTRTCRQPGPVHKFREPEACPSVFSRFNRMHMRKFLLIFNLLLPGVLLAQGLSYYLPDSVQYNPAVPKPKDVIYHEVGEWHVTHDRLVSYMQAIAKAAPDRVTIETMGMTYENRPQALLVITSATNHRNLEAIRRQHLQLTDPAASGSLNLDNMPIVVYIGHSIHGNEPSGANAALVSAYYLAAAQGAAIDDLLEHVVILFDPSFNPDGLQRFSTWANQHKSKNLVTDPASREFNEVWPGGRYNHYWFDLNRDWLPAVHIESQNRLTVYRNWMPNILTDHHEQGSNATFFFQPGVPSRVNPLTPARNQELTTQMAKFHAAYLDRIGSLYFTKENYDDFYYGKGSTYPDINGGIGILFEQASSRGHAQQTSNGILRFPFTIRNQFVTTLSTLEAARTMRKDFLSFQRDFYKTSATEAAAAPTKAYVFGDAADKGKTAIFITMLRRHGIDVYHLANTIKADGLSFEKGSSYIVPSGQNQHRVIRAIFDKTLTYRDSLFYDITAWTMPLAFGLPSAELNASQYTASALGEKLTATPAPAAAAFARSNYAYVLEWTEFYAPAVLYELQSAGISVRVASAPFEMGSGASRHTYRNGTLMIPVAMQAPDADRLYEILTRMAQKYNLPFTPVTTGNVTSGSDLGSSKFLALSKPSIATVVGAGVNPTDAGELWHLLDQRFNIPMSQLETSSFNRVDLAKYNTIILVGGAYADLNKDKLKAWVQGGGTLVLMEEAISWASAAGIAPIGLKKSRAYLDSTASLPYSEKDQLEGSQQVRGAIFRAEADLTHPLAYGYTQPYVSLFKANKVFLERSKNPFQTPFFYKDAPLQSGWVSRQNLDAVRNSAAVVVTGSGAGRVIAIADNPNFRAFWMGGTKLMMNAIFFGRLIETGTAAAD